ncbi:HsdM family class I SAM-dependent methyltransferase [Terrimonas sp.]|uniref:HsdM family class I SAM-dependent methyltransferase n=1 Tax=Terrimonas sp. TaxID=1914338 RepID=UPI001F0BA6BF|nr:N-6 DNA methylase [Terrimonas sp.]
MSLIDSLRFDRAISVKSKSKELLESESIIITEINKKGFNIDSVYFNTDEAGNSFPAVFLKKVKYFDEETLQAIADIHRKIWNYKKVLFLYVYSETEIRIYNCSEKPLVKAKENFDYAKELQSVEIKTYQLSDKKELEELNTLFSRIAIDSGVVWTLKEAQFIRDKINLQRRVDKYLVASLVNTANQLEQQGLKIDFIHKIILRSLFLLYLEDRGATDKKLYSKFKKGATSYFDILDDVNATYQLYEQLEEDFNGNVFTIEKNEKISAGQLQLIKKCFTSGYDNISQVSLFENWRLFDFSIIQIELLSEIYENFLFKTDPDSKKKTGTYYTPPALVEFILNEKLPTNKAEKNYSVRILDPSCGSGIFLVESFKRLVKRYENHHQKKLTDFSKLKKLLTDNIFGIELHPQAIKVAAFSLYLALVDNLDPKTLWQKKKLPNLINNPNDLLLKEQGKNLFCRDTIAQNKEIEDIEFDLVVGNPPFGTNDLSTSVRNYCDKHGFAKEMVLPFLHKATTFAPNGEIALIFNTKVLTNTEDVYQNFRKWLFTKCYVEKVFNFSILRKTKKNFGGQLFDDATGPISIVFYQKDLPQKPGDTIAYYAPKTYIKSNVIEGLSIDFTDLKYLPREECQKPDTKIWKIAMWGNHSDYDLYKHISQKFNTLSEVFEKNPQKWVKGTGLLKASTKNLENNNTQRTNAKIIDTKKIVRYYTNVSALYTTDKLFNPKEFKKFTPPFLLVKEGQQDWMYCATIIEYKAQFLKSAFGIKSLENDSYNKIICALINSNFAKYYLSLISSSWGIERERIQPNEILMLPYIINNADLKLLTQIANFVDNIIHAEKEGVLNEIPQIEKAIDDIIFNVLKIENRERRQILDTITFSLDLLENKEKSTALYPVLKNQPTEYGTIICKELNKFLERQNLFVNATVYNITPFTPLMMIKLSHDSAKKDISVSNELIDAELKKIDQSLWEKKSQNIYFRKKLNYITGNDIYIIRPNQRRFWSKSMAIEDASGLILEILNGN